MFWRLISLIVVCVFVAAVGSCSKGQSPATRNLANASKASARSVRPDQYLTQEDLAILKLPLEERKRVLEGKLREKLVELYGRVPDETGDRVSKQVSDASSSGHRVERAEPEPNVINELLDLDETAEGSLWTLSFVERVEGDLDFNAEVGISDITPIAVHYGHRFPDDPRDPNHDVPIDSDENYIDFEIDRVSTNDFDANGLGVIGIADITPLAMNYGLALEGYNVYLEDKNTSELILLQDLPMEREYVEPPPHRAMRTYTITKEYLEDFDEENPIYIAQTPEETGPGYLETGDRLWVKPVFADDGEGGENTKSDVLEFQVTPTDVPIAVLTIEPDPPVGNEQQVFTFDGSGSYHEHEGTEIDGYLFDYDGDGIVDAQGPESVRLHVYGVSGDYYPKLRVVDEFGVSSSWSDPLHVTVYGPPVIDYFTYVVIEDGQEYSPPFGETLGEPLELPIDVRFKAKAHVQAEDPNVLLTWMKFSFDGDENWEEELEVNDHSADVEVPDPYWTITPDFLGTQHSCTIDSKLLVEDSLNQSTDKALSDDENIGAIPVAHAVPHLVLTTYPDPDPICTIVGNVVTFDASASTDRDGPELWGGKRPTKYEFIFGDGESSIEYDGDPPYADDGTFDGLTMHPYANAGSYTATIKVYDDMFDTEDCVADDLHQDWTTVGVRVYGLLPVLKSNEHIISQYVDDGQEVRDLTWTSLGNPCIAVAINPYSKLPAIAYVGNPESGMGGEWPILVTLFSEKTAVEGPWTTPQLVWVGSEAAAYMTQCDIEYEPTVAAEEG